MSDIELTTFSEFLEESIKLERHIGDIYYLFAQIFTEDKIFWSRLSEEEDKHANVLEGLRPWAAMKLKIDQLLLPDFKELKIRNAAVKEVFEMARKHSPTREIAYNAAYQLELTASEIHYQKLITEKTDNKLVKSMQQLNGEDKNHLKRIKRRMDKLGIKVIADKEK